MEISEMILTITGGISLTSFKTDKGRFTFIGAKDDGRSVYDTIDTLLNLDTNKTLQLKRSKFRNQKALRL